MPERDAVSRNGATISQCVADKVPCSHIHLTIKTIVVTAITTELE
jgi:hypothetical protein